MLEIDMLTSKKNNLTKIRIYQSTVGFNLNTLTARSERSEDGWPGMIAKKAEIKTAVINFCQLTWPFVVNHFILNAAIDQI